MVDLIQADYEQLQLIAARFAAQAEAVTVTEALLQERVARLRETWRGSGADAFFAEMETVLATLNRLGEALEEAAQVTQRIARTIRAAEEAAAALFAGRADEEAPRWRPPIAPSTPDPNAAAEEAAWQARDAWYRAHGRAWNPVTGQWDKPILSDISDVNVARQLLGEAGITLDGSWRDADILQVAMGVADIARVTPGGISQLRELLGGEVTFHRSAWDPIFLRNQAHVPPPFMLPGAHGRHVYFPQGVSVDKYVVVHELAHVLDWNNTVRVTDDAGQDWPVIPSDAFPHGPWLTDYASDPYANLEWPRDILAPIFQEPTWEYWAEGFSLYVYGPAHPRWPEVRGNQPNAAQKEFIKQLLDRRSD